MRTRLRRRGLRLGLLGLLVGSTMVSLLVGSSAVSSADAAVSKCQAKNLQQGTKESPNLQALINTANPGETIQVKGVCVGNFTTTKSLSLVGKPTKEVPAPALDANNSGRPLFVDGQNVSTSPVVTVSGLTIRNGQSTGSGAGIALRLATLTLNDSSVTNNSSTQSVGGGITVILGTLTLNNSSVTANSAVQGGGIHVNALGGVSTVTLNDSDVSGNLAGGGSTIRWGGGIANIGALGVVVLNGSSSVHDNFAGRFGGGIYNEGTFTMNGSSSVTDNRAGEDGGGIYNDCGGTLNGVTGGGNVSGNIPNNVFAACP